MKIIKVALFFLLSSMFFKSTAQERPISLKVSAQQSKKVDSIYYLVDTLHTSVSDRMWDIRIDKVAMCKLYTVRCPCLKNGGSPTFLYSIEHIDNGVYIKKSELNKRTLVTLYDLIIDAKRNDDKQSNDLKFFFIEPVGREYLIHNVIFENPTIQIVSPPDFIDARPKIDKP